MKTTSVKEHYDQHLGNFYSWMTGEFEPKKNAFARFCEEQGLLPRSSGRAIDLGAAHGIQSLALAGLGYEVLAVDFNAQLLAELHQRAEGLHIRILNKDIRMLASFADGPELITCCGDTLPHLGSLAEIGQLLREAFTVLLPGGSIVLSFRDYGQALEGNDRFIPVYSDPQRIFTCVLDYLPGHVVVTDLVYEFTGQEWKMKSSSYSKVRITRAVTVEMLEGSGFQITANEIKQGMVWLVGKKPA